MIWGSDLWLDTPRIKVVPLCFLHLKHIAKIETFLCIENLYKVTNYFRITAIFYIMGSGEKPYQQDLSGGEYCSQAVDKEGHVIAVPAVLH